MVKLGLLRSIRRRSTFCRIPPPSAAVSDPQLCHALLSYPPVSSRRFFHHLSPFPVLPSSKHHPTHIADRRASTCSSFAGESRYPDIKDSQINEALKDLMACDWKDLPAAVIHDAKKALSKNTNDKAGWEALANVFRAAEAVEEFGGILITLRMKCNDAIGLMGEDAKPLPVEFTNALQTIFSRYNAYLDSFGPEETYLRKKVEIELGTKIIHLKMRCAGLGAEWGKTTVLGTSGLSGSYIEQRAR